MNKIILLLFCLTFAPKTFANQLQPFVTDYCTMFSNGTFEKPDLWKHCCLDHDIRYWYGGTEINMDQADLNLKSCVEKVAGTSWATLIYSGVRAGHYSPIKNVHKWSWGWETNRGDKELNANEKIYILEEIHQLPFGNDVIENFINNNF
jgi:hypothetical protein